jgi:hypothetical protein
MVSGALSWTGIVVSDVVAARWGGFPPTRRAVVVWSEHAWRGAPLGGTTRRGDVYENVLGMPPLRGALSLLHRRSFQQVSQLLMDVLSLIGRGLRGRPHDHGGRCDVLAGSREDGCLPPARLDLIIHTTYPRPRAFSVKVLRARASVVTAFVGLISFTSPSSF